MLGKLIAKDKSFYKTVAVVAVPIAMQSLITVGVNMMDTIMVGRVGETELSAVSLANTFINIYHILCMGLSMGASVLVARFYGMRNMLWYSGLAAYGDGFCDPLAARHLKRGYELLCEMMDYRNTTPGDDWLSKTHLIHTIVDKHLDIAHFYNLLPEIW